MANQNQAAAGLPPSIRSLARGWLGWQHGLSTKAADYVLDGLPIPNTNYGKLRQEAIDVAEYMEHVANG